MALDRPPKTPFRKIMEEKKTIPSYQRDFVWAEDDVKSFVENLWEASEDSSLTNYFCGSMVLFQNSDGIYEIVDGQQRTTVVYVLMCNLINAVDDDERKMSWRLKYIQDYEIDGRKTALFTHKLDDVRKFIDDVGQGVVDRSSINQEILILQTLYDCYETINEFVMDKIGTDQKKLSKFFKFVSEDAFVIHYLAENMSDALLTYTRLNTGGKQLGHLEIVKGLLYASVEKSGGDWNIFEDKWSDFWSELGKLRRIGSQHRDKAKEIIKQDIFLTYFLLTNYPDVVNDYCSVSDGFTPTSKLTDLLQSQEADDAFFSRPTEFLDKLKYTSDMVIAIRTGSHNNSTTLH